MTMFFLLAAGISAYLVIGMVAYDLAKGARSGHFDSAFAALVAIQGISAICFLTLLALGAE